MHFGEIEAGRIDDHPNGPILRVAPRARPPYPETMNHGAVAEIAAIDPAAVIVKGDLSTDGTDEEWAAFEACYRTAFGERLHVVRGNHDAYQRPGRATPATVDRAARAERSPCSTRRFPASTTGCLTTGAARLARRARRAAADRPVLVMGHHQQWIAGQRDRRGATRSDDYFGLHPDSSDALDERVRPPAERSSATRPGTPTATVCGG